MNINALVQQLDTVDNIPQPKNVQFGQNNIQPSSQSIQPNPLTTIKPIVSQNNVAIQPPLQQQQMIPSQQQQIRVPPTQVTPQQTSSQTQTPQQVGFVGETMTILGTQISKKTLYFAIFLIAILAIFYFFNKNKKTLKKKKNNKSKKSSKNSDEEDDDDEDNEDE